MAHARVMREESVKEKKCVFSAFEVIEVDFDSYVMCRTGFQCAAFQRAPIYIYNLFPTLSCSSCSMVSPIISCISSGEK